MTATTYTFHRAADHQILDTAEPATLQQIAATVADKMNGQKTGRNTASRVYVHNGAGVIAAGLCKHGLWHEILRDDYRQFDQQARELRTAAGLAND